MATITLPEAEVETSRQETKKSATKYVYFFGGGKADGNGKMKDVLGGKGAGLAETLAARVSVHGPAGHEHVQHDQPAERGAHPVVPRGEAGEQVKRVTLPGGKPTVRGRCHRDIKATPRAACARASSGDRVSRA